MLSPCFYAAIATLTLFTATLIDIAMPLPAATIIFAVFRCFMILPDALF